MNEQSRAHIHVDTRVDTGIFYLDESNLIEIYMNPWQYFVDDFVEDFAVFVKNVPNC